MTKKKPERLMMVWHVEQICWDQDPKSKKGQMETLLVEADSCAGAAILAGEGDGIHQIQRIINMGPVVARQIRSGK